MPDKPLVDHLVFACPDLERGIEEVEDLLGVRAEAGGVHEGLGTRNALLGLGPASYLEVVSVDPDQFEPERPRWFGLDDLDASRLVTWSSAVLPPDEAVAVARVSGVDLGAVRNGSRKQADGTTLRWRFTDPWADRLGGVVPFLIDWGGTPHPGAKLPDPCRLVELRASHPRPGEARAALEALGLTLVVEAGPRPALTAVLESPRGEVELC